LHHLGFGKDTPLEFLRASTFVEAANSSPEISCLLIGGRFPVEDLSEPEFLLFTEFAERANPRSNLPLIEKKTHPIEA